MKSFLGPRSRRRLNQHTAPPVPTQRLATTEAYTWGVNALLESGRTELAYELAAAYLDEA